MGFFESPPDTAAGHPNISVQIRKHLPIITHASTEALTALIAQQAEHRTFNPRVVGSIPTEGTKTPRGTELKPETTPDEWHKAISELIHNEALWAGFELVPEVPVIVAALESVIADLRKLKNKK